MFRQIAVLALAAIAAPAAAQPKTGDVAALIQKIVDCRTAPDDAAQLACYRQAADALVRAEATGDIVVVDRDQARAVRRQAFGLSLPSLSVLEKGESEQELSTLKGLVRTARQDTTGRWTLELDSGGTWTQVDTAPMLRAPKPGSPVTITRAALGSYRLKVGDLNAVRVRRVE